MATKAVRTRIAPSPTGDPHVGTAYVALFNYALARKHGGQFILRIEDTDRQRSHPASEQMIFEALNWLGLKWDEGPDIGGPHGPYRQSERSAIYREHAAKLVDQGAAYPCFCTAERLEALRAEQKAHKAAIMGYDRHCRRIEPAEARRRSAAGEAHVIRLAMPEDDAMVVSDLLRGEVRFERPQMDDQVLLKSDGFPTYHLANVVDDHLMEISHVIRAEEWLSSLPKHVQLYRSFGWEAPIFCHLPLLRNADRSKISKRKNPVSLNHYRRAGFLPEALLNFLALMGFAMSDEREEFTLDELVAEFALERIALGGPVFDTEKLAWLNGKYLRRMAADQLIARLREHLLSD
jgi:glutamyl-tRNA synthetase